MVKLKLLPYYVHDAGFPYDKGNLPEKTTTKLTTPPKWTALLGFEPSHMVVYMVYSLAEPLHNSSISRNTIQRIQSNVRLLSTLMRGQYCTVRYIPWEMLELVLRG